MDRPQTVTMAHEFASISMARTLASYAAYLAVVCVAVMIALGALLLSGQTALAWLEDVRRPVESRSLPMTQNVTFSMLPQGVPADVKNSGVIDQF